MNRQALQVVGIAFGVTLVAPAVVYLLTGGLIGVVLPCGEGGTIAIATFEESALSVSCDIVGVLVRTVIATAGTTALVLGVFVLGIAGLFSQAESQL